MANEVNYAELTEAQVWERYKALGTAYDLIATEYRTVTRELDKRLLAPGRTKTVTAAA